MDVQYVQHWGDDLIVANAARVSFDKKSDWHKRSFEETPVGESYFVLSDKDTKLVNSLARMGHTSCFEHMGATLKLKVPIFIARQIQRHRTFSYNEISRRYVDSPPEFFWPDKWRGRAKDKKQGSSDEEITQITRTVKDARDPAGEKTVTFTDIDLDLTAKNSAKNALKLYNDMLASGVAPELARMILPQNMYTEFYMSGNLRAWEHLLKLRLDGHAQVEVQVVAQQALAILEPLFPVSMKALMEN